MSEQYERVAAELDARVAEVSELPLPELMQLAYFFRRNMTEEANALTVKGELHILKGWLLDQLANMTEAFSRALEQSDAQWDKSAEQPFGARGEAVNAEPTPGNLVQGLRQRIEQLETLLAELRVKYRDACTERDILRTKIGTDQAPGDWLQARDDAAFTRGYEQHKRDIEAERADERANSKSQIAELVVAAIALPRGKSVRVKYRPTDAPTVLEVDVLCDSLLKSNWRESGANLVGRKVNSVETFSILTTQIVDIVIS